MLGFWFILSRSWLTVTWPNPPFYTAMNLTAAESNKQNSWDITLAKAFLFLKLASGMPPS